MVAASTARRAALVLAVGVLLTLAAGSAAPAVPLQDTRPNIVVIETDDQTVDSLRVMANVDRMLVREGARFDTSFASYPLCCPSRATLLTGQYAHNHGVLGNQPPQGGYVALDHRNTLPVWLQRAGYHTAFVGKYLNGYGERDRTEVPPGWSDWTAALRTPGTRSLSYLGFDLNENGVLFTYPRSQASYQTDVFTQKAVDRIWEQAGSGSPLFLWLAYFAPHSGGPFDADDARAPGVMTNPRPAARHRDAFAGEPFLSPPSFDEPDVSDKPPAVRRPRLTPAQIKAIEESYEQRLESLLAVDEGVAQIVQALNEAGMLANTLIVFTSDNGFMQGEHRLTPDRGKGSAYEPSVRVPLVLRGPGISGGRRVKDVVSNVDLAPTILSAARALPGLPLDGRSLLPFARGRPVVGGGRDLLLASKTFTAIRTDRYVYIAHRNGAKELYDLETDPHQLRSLHASPALGEIRAELARRLRLLRRCSGATCRRGPDLKLRVASSKGRSLRAGIVGADVPWVASTRFYVNGKWVAVDRRAPFSVVLPPSLLNGSLSTIGARVRTTDGRTVTMTRTAARLR